MIASSQPSFKPLCHLISWTTFKEGEAVLGNIVIAKKCIKNPVSTLDKGCSIAKSAEDSLGPKPKIGGADNSLQKKDLRTADDIVTVLGHQNTIEQFWFVSKSASGIRI